MVDETTRPVRRVGLVFSGGPAPGANAVISAAVTALRREGVTVLGFRHGYTALQAYDPDTAPLVEGRDYQVFEDRDLWGLRNARGVSIGTARAHPGRPVRHRDDLDDPERTARLARVHRALTDLDVDALVSIGGDGTLITATLLHRWQQAHRPVGRPVVRVIHLPKTIDNDYRGIDFTFGFFTAMDVMAKELLNLRADAMATGRYYVAECQGRSAGWLAYGVAVAGEAHMVLGVEDLDDSLLVEETSVDPATGDEVVGRYLSLDALSERVVDLIRTREAKGKRYGTVVLAEGLAAHLPPSVRRRAEGVEDGHVRLGTLQIGTLVARRAAERYAERTGRSKTLTGVQLGYEARCAAPHAFDVLLGTQLGVGAARALLEDGQDGVMVSLAGQLELRYVPFADLVDPVTLKPATRYIQPGSDFHRLAHTLETKLPRPRRAGGAPGSSEG